ncbi:MAG: hypothetical protein Q9183_005991, partial [Haloplaca sp. 2 TL-2023]
IGGATPLPQEGNPKPRVWRIPSQRALINRYGLNSEGADHIQMRLRQRVREYAYRMGFGIDEEAEQRILDGEAGVPPGSLQGGKLMAVQIAKNKWTPDQDIEAVKKDYVYCVNALARYADIVVVNVSSPNTPGLRGLQKSEPLTDILTAVVGAARKVKRKTPPAVMVKVSPDEDGDVDVRGICDAVWDSGVDGVVVGNTTRRRPDALPQGYNLPALEQRIMLEQGGYSGPQTFERTVALVKRYRKILDDGSYGRNGIESPQQSEPKLATGTETPASPTIGTPVQAPEVTHPPTTMDEIEGTVTRDKENQKLQTPEAENDSRSQPLFRLPERHTSSTSSSSSPSENDPSPSSSVPSSTPPPPTLSNPDSAPSSLTSAETSTQTPSSPNTSREPSRKIIFATGGITNGSQVLEVLSAGADVAQVYTALVYGGIGTVSKIKEDMRDELRKQRDLR